MTKESKALMANLRTQEKQRRKIRLSQIKDAIARADFYDNELYAIEAIVFQAYGRTKLSRDPQ